MLSISMHMQNLVKIHSLFLKILSRNEILTSYKGHNSVINWQKWMLNNPKLDDVNINAYAKFGQNPFIRSQHIERKQNSDVFKGHNSVLNWRKFTLNNPELDVVNINASKKFGHNPFIHTQDIEETKFWHHSRAITKQQKFMLNNPKLSISIHMQNLVKIHQSFPKILSRNENVTDTQTDGQPQNSIGPLYVICWGYK